MGTEPVGIPPVGIEPVGTEPVGTEAVGGGGIELAEVTYPDGGDWVCPTSLCPGTCCGGPTGVCGGIVQPAIGW